MEGKAKDNIINYQNIFKMIGCTALIFVVMYLQNHFTIMYADDFCLSKSSITNNIISSFSELMESVKVWRTVYNGRIITGFITQFLLSIGYKVHDVMNAFAFAGMVWLIYYHSFHSFKKIDCKWILSIFAFIWFCTPEFGQSFLWISGSSNFLYGTLGLLIYFIPFTYCVEHEVRKHHIIITALETVVLFVYGFIAGALVENITAAAVVGSFLYCLYFYAKNKKFCMWMCAGGIGNLMGGFFLLLSPAEIQRISITNDGSKGILHRIIGISVSFLPAVLPIAIFIIILWMVCIRQGVNVKEGAGYETGIWLFISLAAICSLMLTDNYPDRAFAPAMVFLIVCMGNLYSRADIQEHLKRTERMVLIGVVCVALMGSYMSVLRYNFRNMSEYETREAIIKTAVKNGENEVFIPAILSKSKYDPIVGDGDLEWNDVWINQGMASYYGLKKVTRIQ